MKRILIQLLGINPCRWFGHNWWTEDFQDEMWGAYEMLTCRRCGDWLFAQENRHSDETTPHDTLTRMEEEWRISENPNDES